MNNPLGIRYLRPVGAWLAIGLAVLAGTWSISTCRERGNPGNRRPPSGDQDDSADGERARRPSQSAGRRGRHGKG